MKNKGLLIRLFFGTIVVLFACMFRYLYAQAYPEIQILPDSVGYYTIGTTMIRDPSLIINYWRTPIYPLFIQAVMVFCGVFGAPIGSEEFYSGMKCILIIQGIIGVLGSVVFFSLLLRIGFSVRQSLFFSLIHTFNMLIIHWERHLLAESLAIFLIIIFMYMFVLLVEKPTVARFALYLGISLILPLTKPLLLPLSLSGLAVLIVYKRCVRVLIYSAFIGLCVLSIPILYSYYNLQKYGYGEFQSTSAINMFGIVLKYRLEPNNLSSYEFFGPALRAWYNQEEGQDPYSFIDSFDSSAYYTPQRLKEIRSLSVSALSDNFNTYFISSVGDFVQGVGDFEESFYTTDTTVPMSWVINRLLYFGKIMVYLYLLMMIFFPILILLYRKKDAKTFDFVVLIGVIVAFQISFVALCSAGQYLRLIAPFIPFMFLYGGYSFYQIVMFHPMFRSRNTVINKKQPDCL